jgi:hypothetical protein
MKLPFQAGSKWRLTGFGIHPTGYYLIDISEAYDIVRKKREPLDELQTPPSHNDLLRLDTQATS